MPDTSATLTFLKRLDLYQHEKPFFYYKLANGTQDVDEKTDNLEFEERQKVLVRNIRGREHEFSLDTSGFQIIHNKSNIKEFKTKEDVASYRSETADTLKSLLGAEHVQCYEARVCSLPLSTPNPFSLWNFLQAVTSLRTRLRRNVVEQRTSMDLRDSLNEQRPAVGAHIDYTFESGPRLIDMVLPSGVKEKYLKPGYRFRIVNTWRSLVENLEDSPLAVCDSRTVEPNDLIPLDRVFPDSSLNIETYLIHFNENQHWYWLDRMCSNEPLVMLMYDSKFDSEAKYCPHVGMTNATTPQDAVPRYSVETRSIVISLD